MLVAIITVQDGVKSLISSSLVSDYHIQNYKIKKKRKAKTERPPGWCWAQLVCEEDRRGLQEKWGRGTLSSGVLELASACTMFSEIRGNNYQGMNTTCSMLLVKVEMNSRPHWRLWWSWDSSPGFLAAEFRACSPLPHTVIMKYKYKYK